MKILLTGCSGFVGSHLLKLLTSDKNNQIFGLSRAPLNLVAANFKNIIVDLTQDDFTSQLKDPVDVVIHLAQSRKYREFPEGADDMFKINVAATINLLEWSRRTGTKRFIFSSSGSVYKPGQVIFNENSPLTDTGFYSLSKLFSEGLIHEYVSYFETIILRLFTVYGPGQKGMIIPNTIEKIKNQQPIALAQNEGAMLSPLYVDDCCKMIERVVHEDMDNGVYNLSGNVTLSLQEIISIASKALKIKTKTISENSIPPFLAADSSKLYDAVHLKPMTSIETGIHKTIESQTP